MRPPPERALVALVINVPVLVLARRAVDAADRSRAVCVLAGITCHARGARLLVILANLAFCALSSRSHCEVAVRAARAERGVVGRADTPAGTVGTNTRLTMSCVSAGCTCWCGIGRGERGRDRNAFGVFCD